MENLQIKPLLPAIHEYEVLQSVILMARVDLAAMPRNLETSTQTSLL
jgi:hypothetical protein